MTSRLSPSIAVLAVTLGFAVSADQVPSRFQTAPLITQGPGSDIRASVRDLRDSDERADGVQGVVITEVSRDGPAQRAGLIVGDIVMEFDRVTIADSTQFRRIVRDTPPDRAVTVNFWRDGTRREAKITPVVARAQ